LNWLVLIMSSEVRVLRSRRAAGSSKGPGDGGEAITTVRAPLCAGSVPLGAPLTRALRVG
jgi:hypothetical protein